MGSRLAAAAMTIMLLSSACARSEKAPGAAFAAREERVMGSWTVRSPQIARKTSRGVAAVALVGLVGAAVFGLWHRPG
jgi:hypothetical protein